MSEKVKLPLRKLRYSAQFKEQALEKAEKIGAIRAAEDLGIAANLIYVWRKRRTQTGIPFEEQKLQGSEVASLRRQVARLSEKNAFLKKAAAYFAKEPK